MSKGSMVERMAPKAWSDVSVSTMSGSLGLHLASTRAVVNAFFRDLKELRQALEKSHGVPLRVRCVNGTVIFE